MFNFMKKNTNPSSSASTSSVFDKEQEKEKDKRKKEKRKIDTGKKRDRAHLSTEEILRIDEVRRSLKIRGRRKDKEKLPSGITADYTASFLAGLVEHNGEDTVDQASTTSSLPFNTQESPHRSSLHLADPSSFTQSDTSSETSLTSSAGRPLPPLPPRPPKRGILKGSKNVISKSNKQVTRPPPATLPGISSAVVEQNTIQNEVISYENTINGGIIPETAIPISPDQESLSDTTNSSFATPPLSLSPEGKAQGLYPHSTNIECPLPKLRQISLPPPRDVVLHRSGPSGEFGLSLRRALLPSSSPNHPPTSLVLAEPGQMASSSNGSHRLLPGDRLNQVNDIEVKNKPREEIIQIIRSSGSVLKIQVEPIVELSEFSKRLLVSQEDDEKEKMVNNCSSNSTLSLDPCSSSGSGTLKRSASRRFYKDSSTARTESEILDSQSNEQSFWLMHRSGFSEATLVEDGSATPTSAVASPSSSALSQDVGGGKVSVRLEATKQIITVHPDDLEKANPASMDFCEDLCSLRHLNESSVLHTLRQRYGNHLVYTRAGPALIAINPAAPLPIYSDKLVPLLRGCKPEDTPPHIYSLAQQAFQQAMSTRRDQSIVFLGRSGSGSTSNAHRAMEYIAQAATPSVSGASIFSDRTNSVSSSATLTQSSSSNFISSGKGTIGIDHLQAAWIVLEAFCNAQTPLNSNASRATQLWTLELDHSGFINAVSIQVLLLDRARVYRRRPSSSHPDNNFHVFYYLLAAACDDETPLPRDLQLQLNLQTRSHGQSPNPVATLVSNTGTSTTSGPTNSGNCILGWTRLVAAMHRLGFQENEMRVIWSVLAAIIHLGSAGVVKVGSRWQFGQPHWAQVACQLLGISFDDLARILFNTTSHSANSTSSTNSNSPNSTPRTSSTNSTGIRTPSPESSNHPSLGGSGIDNLEGLLGSWYGELVGLVLSLVNRNLSSTSHGVCSILLLDTPGFQNPSTSSLQNFGTLEDLWTNYLHERLQSLMEHHLLAQPRSKYLQEQITIDLDDELLDEYQLVGFLDREPRPWAPMSNLLRHSSSPSSNTNSSNNNSHANNNHYASPSGSSGSNNHDSSVADSLDSSEKPGLLWIIDHEAMMLPGTSDQQLLERIFNYYSDREDHLLIRRAPSGGTTSSCYLAVQHLRGTNPVLYSLNGWLRKSREHPVHTHAIGLLHSTQRDEICQLFRGGSLHATSLPLGPGVADVVASASASAAAASLRRASSIRRTQAHAGAAIKRKSLCLQVKFTADAIIEILRKTSVFYVYTMIANQTPSINCVNDDLNVPMLRSQLRGSQLLPIMRLYKQGLPFAMRFGEFARRFSLLALPSESCAVHPVLAKLISRSSRCSLDEEKEAAKWLQEHIDGLEVSHCRLGSSQIFFRAGVLSQLEAQRDAKLTAFFIRLQAQCRGFLSRKKLAKLKVQDVAIRCIQRNVRKYLRVREWTWYRLYIHLSPLLLACRSETKYNEEVESLRARVNKLEQERLALKHENERLDARISELSADLADEHSAATLASERLEAECAERARLEQEIQSVQMENKALQQSTERLETELHLVRSTELNDLEAALESSGACEEQDLGNSGTGATLYKHRYERATRELELAKKRMQQQHEADLEQLVGLKKQMDKKLADAYEEVDEQRKVVAQWKRKVQKLTSEANDVRLLLEEQNSRNNLLEKKQRKFDSELQKLNEELRQERNQKERATRERDIITTEKQQVEQMLAALKLELDLKDELIAERTKELDEMAFGGKSEEDFSLIKKQKADLEKKLEEQEDELDDLAGQVQLLEQAKTRLEMCLEQQRKEHRREMQQRDDELEEARSSSIKKLKALEMQLETEHEHKTNLLRARHELERRYQLAEERNKTIISKFEDTTAKLKRDLIRTKALLKDTQAALEQSRGENNPARVRLRSLKIQMEDLEIARDSALKAKQSLERDLLDTQSTLDECINARRDAEERGTAMARDLADVKSQLDENEDELAEILKKYKAAVNQLSTEQKHVHEQIQLVSELESERQTLKDQIHELQTKLDHALNMLRSSSAGSVASASGGSGSTPVEGTRQDMKIRELESKLDLEKTTRSRLEVQITRLKESLDKTTKESTQAKTKEQQAQIELRRIQASIRTLNEQQASLKSKDNEFAIKLRDSERRAKIAETEAAAARRETEEMRARLESLTEALEKDVNESTDSNEDDSELSNIDDDEDDHSQQRNFETSMESFRPGESSI